ncbi:hypothetical protein Clacol_000399 [Clathrus columnatus]|uniref:Proteasome assembly chaperone 2 n=1 Tax=Clathrus columnatus TaxID=1419009 RepID=A0AAV4ZX32_9AGAM|nr:hypothetical protein Clacol_000399 [Clathrus columnatus]
MEKPPNVKIPQKRIGFVTFRTAIFAILSLFFLNNLFHKFSDPFLPNSVLLNRDDESVVRDPLTFEWGKITPSANLQWHTCGEQRECARLELPMDHLQPSGETVAIALVRVPASNKEDYRGPILLNPGGPGGSGVMFAHRIGNTYQKLIGDEYDIVGFDPRGIGATTPKVSSFLDDTERGVWDAGVPPLMNSTSDAFIQAYSRANIFGQLAFSRSKHAAEYVSTANVARDMLNITNAFGFEKLKYWGFSYGTLLGGTFAAMFPDHVERLIIDGRWYSNLVDTDKILTYIFDACVAAGEDCPLYAPTSNEVEARVEAIFESLREKPIPAFNGTHYAVLDYKTVKSLLFTDLYKPFTSIGPFFDALAALEKGNGDPMLNQISAIRETPKCGGVPKSSIVPVSIAEGGVAVRCGEGQGVGFTIGDLRTHFEELRNLSVFADVWSEIRIECSGWKIKAKERYEGDFNTTTSFPLLIIGNTRDPVTPLFAAKKAHEGFHNSALLTVDTPGHCSSAGTSPVALKYIRDYFREGALPPVGTVCPIEDKLFIKNSENTMAALNMKEEERQFLELTKEFVQVLHFPIVSVANVPQLAADILIATFSLSRIAVFDPKYHVPVVGARELSDHLGVTTPCELFGSDDFGFVVLQQRSPVLKTQKEAFISAANSVFREFAFKSVLFVTAIDSTYRTDDQMRTPLFHFTPVDLRNSALSQLTLLPLYTTRTPNQSLRLPGGGLTKRFISSPPEKLDTGFLIWMGMEGDNREDAKLVANVIAKILSIDQKAKDWKIPESWKQGLFGPPNDGTLYG